MKTVLVYGTLRKGFGNNTYMNNCEFISKGLTKEKYKLTANGIPFVSKSEPISNITIEAYKVPESQMPFIDRLEGYDPGDHEGSWYKRSKTKAVLENGEEIEGYLYFNDSEGSTLIKSGNYEDYRR